MKPPRIPHGLPAAPSPALHSGFRPATPGGFIDGGAYHRGGRVELDRIMRNMAVAKLAQKQPQQHFALGGMVQPTLEGGPAFGNTGSPQQGTSGGLMTPGSGIAPAPPLGPATGIQAVPPSVDPGAGAGGFYHGGTPYRLPSQPIQAGMFHPDFRRGLWQ